MKRQKFTENILYLRALMEGVRQQKVAKLIQVDLANIFRELLQDTSSGVMVSVTKVNVTVDFSLAKVYLSIFPSDRSSQMLGIIKNEKKQIRRLLAQKVKQQLRRTPQLCILYR